MELTLYPEVTVDLILNTLNEEMLMEHYLGLPVKKGLFRSPLRHDPNPTCSFVRNKSGRLMFKDFNGSFYGDVFEVVQKLFNVTFYQALTIIANDFGLIKIPTLQKNHAKIEYTNKPFEDTGISNIQIEVQPFSEGNLNWWKQFNINEDILNKFRVFSCKSVFLNGKYLTGCSEKDPIYSYYRGQINNIDYFRIYFPMRKSYRFLSNWSAKMIQGSQQLPRNGEILVITKSMKDVMCLYSFGINAIAPNSETLFLTSNQWENIKKRFKHIFLLYDNDLAGISNMNRIRKKFDVKCLWLPRNKAKDISDYCSLYGIDETEKLIQQTKEWLKRKKLLN